MKKILIIRFSSIGDIVLTTPVVRCLRRQLPDVEIHVLTKAAFRTIYAENPYVAKVIVMDDELKKILPGLREEKYDYVVDLHRNWRSWRVRLSLRCPSSTFPKLDFQKFLYTKLKIGSLPEVHIVDRYFRAVKKLGITNDGEGLDYFIAEKDEIRFTDLPAMCHEGFVAMVVGGQHNTKILPIDKAVEVCQLLCRPVILVGGPDDAPRGEAIVNAVGPSVFNSCGKLTLGQSASLLKLADVVITNDTGMMHIAAALRKRIVSIWGNTVPEFGMYPYLPVGMEPAVIIEDKTLRCRPCDKLGYDRCPRGHFKCMKSLDTKLIAEKTKAGLSPGLRGGTSGN
ncbi:MAG: glycosyltransferase family 9 protein [Bacteroidales bacterium]|nr:glycosyltransferase family 9 protein [Bacteroidales bacterium]